jgi:membrane-associated protein
VIGLPQLDVSSPLSYLVALIPPALDALLPVVPSETAVIALGVATAGHSDPRIAALVALAACGAFLGDNLAYLLGRRFGPVVDRRFFSGERGKRRRAWAEHALDRYGARIIIACRFVPGGRTAVTLTCGTVGYRRRSFVAATACAGLIWAAYAFLIGRLGGQTFEDRPWLGLLLALGAALVISVLVEVLRRTRPWRLIMRVRSRPSRGSGEPVAARSTETGRGQPGQSGRGAATNSPG